MSDRVPDSGPAAIGPAVSISVVSHGQSSLIATLFEDLAANVKIPFECILTLNIPETLPFDPNHVGFPLRIIENPTARGYGANQNAAFHVCRGPVFCVLNPDIRIARDPFPALLDCLRDPTVGVAAPLIMSPRGTVEDSARRFPTPLSILAKAAFRRTSVDYAIGNDLVYPDWVAGMFMLFPREIFASLGGFNERYFLYYEDVELCARISLAGRRAVLCPTASVVHDARRQSLKTMRYARWHLCSMMRYFLFWIMHLASRHS